MYVYRNHNENTILYKPLLYCIHFFKKEFIIFNIFQLRGYVQQQ